MEIHYTYPEVTLLLPSVLNVGFLWKIRDIMKQSVYAKMSIYLIVMIFEDSFFDYLSGNSVFCRIWESSLAIIGLSG